MLEDAVRGGGGGGGGFSVAMSVQFRIAQVVRRTRGKSMFSNKVFSYLNSGPP